MGRLKMIHSDINLHRLVDKITIQMSRFFGKSIPISHKTMWVMAALLIGFQFAWAGNPEQDAGFGAFVTDQATEMLSAAGDIAPASDMGIGEDAYSSKPNTVGVEYTNLYSTLAITVGALLLVVLLLVFVSANLVNLIRVREGKEAFSFKGTLDYAKEMALNPFIATGGGFVALVIGLFIIVPVMRGVGLSQGYQPDQPIWFSHKIHAGEYEIDCQYCHSGASKGKNAWIPSVNVCMNCHKAIKEGKISGTQEISKIYTAYENNVPVEWVRIHNLPDLAYFNHQQHVVAGKQECETCHGPVAEMDVVEQWSPLSMGWCINCHRETEVDSELYEKLGRDDVHTVKDIGGLDCARCHY